MRQALLAGWLHQADDNVPSMLSLLDVAANEGAALAWSSDQPGRMQCNRSFDGYPHWSMAHRCHLSAYCMRDLAECTAFHARSP